MAPKQKTAEELAGERNAALAKKYPDGVPHEELVQWDRDIREAARQQLAEAKAAEPHIVEVESTEPAR